MDAHTARSLLHKTAHECRSMLADLEVGKRVHVDAQMEEARQRAVKGLRVERCVLRVGKRAEEWDVSYDALEKGYIFMVLGARHGRAKRLSPAASAGEGSSSTRSSAQLVQCCPCGTTDLVGTVSSCCMRLK